jgi:alpha-beta hydrolase superfamily lysophospholipase
VRQIGGLIASSLTSTVNSECFILPTLTLHRPHRPLPARRLRRAPGRVRPRRRRRRGHHHPLAWHRSRRAAFRTPIADAPAFRFGQSSTRFLGDLYQDLSEDVRKRYALLQTPDFVESFGRPREQVDDYGRAGRGRMT